MNQHWAKNYEEFLIHGIDCMAQIVKQGGKKWVQTCYAWLVIIIALSMSQLQGSHLFKCWAFKLHQKGSSVWSPHCKHRLHGLHITKG